MITRRSAPPEGPQGNCRGAVAFGRATPSLRRKPRNEIPILIVAHSHLDCRGTEKCALRAVVTIKGKTRTVEVEQIKRTSGGHSLSMDKLEMTAYMDKCAQITSHPLPTPEELEAMGYIHN